MLKWPGNRPDLNPIENLWNLVKNKVSKKLSSSLDALKTAIIKVWVSEISEDYCCKLIKQHAMLPAKSCQKQGQSHKILFVNVLQ